MAKWVASTLPGVKYYATPEEVFELPSDAVDAVLISTITSTHAPLTIAAIQKGWHVLLEKPISIDVEDSKPVVAAADANKDVKVMIGFVRRCKSHSLGVIPASTRWRLCSLRSHRPHR